MIHLSKKLLSRLQPCFFESKNAFLFVEQSNKVTSFKSIAPAMISHLRRFIATPLSIFQFEFTSDQQIPPVLLVTAKCLALCIQVSIEEPV